MSDILIFKAFLFSGICPGKTFIKVDTSINATHSNEYSPTNRFKQLNKG